MIYSSGVTSETVQGELSNGLDFRSHLQGGSRARGRSGRAGLSRMLWGCGGSFISRDFCKKSLHHAGQEPAWALESSGLLQLLTFYNPLLETPQPAGQTQGHA